MIGAAMEAMKQLSVRLACDIPAAQGGFAHASCPWMSEGNMKCREGAAAVQSYWEEARWK
jgi:hypothetical protein